MTPFPRKTLPLSNSSHCHTPPFFADNGVTLQFFPSSMYSPVNAIKSSLLPISAFISTCLGNETISAIIYQSHRSFWCVKGLINALVMLVVREWDKYDWLRFAWQLRKISTKSERYVRIVLWTVYLNVTYGTNIKKLIVLFNRRKERTSRPTSFEKILEKAKKQNSLPESLKWSWVEPGHKPSSPGWCLLRSK